MLRLGLPSALEDESPREVGHISVNLGVAQVSEPDERCGERHGNRQMVKNPQEIDVVLLPVPAREPPHAQEQHQRPPVAGESSVPDGEDLKETFPGAEIIVRLIEYAVPETRPDKSANQQGVEKRIKKGLVDLFPLEEPREYPVTKNETGDKQETIPPYGERSNPEYLRIHIPMYEQKIHNLKITFRTNLHKICDSYAPSPEKFRGRGVTVAPPATRG